MKNAPSQLGQRRYRTRLKTMSGWPDLTALVDILFLALLFFALASRVVQVSGISVALPQVKAQNTVSLERFVISITPPEPGGDPRGTIYFRDRRFPDAKSLRNELAALHNSSKKASVVIRADRGVPFETVAEVMATAEEAGMPSFIAVIPPENTPSTTFEN